MKRPAFRCAAAVLLAGSMVFVTACSNGGGPQTIASQAPTPNATSPAPSESGASGKPAAPVGDPTCENIIPESVTETFDSVGWTYRAESFRIGAIVLTEGISCVWGDYTVASDQVQLFGWAPISRSESESAQRALLESGWIRERGETGDYITESESTTVGTDSEGYGLTYLFGDGWIKLADTKQGLLLIQWPPR